MPEEQAFPQTMVGEKRPREQGDNRFDQTIQQQPKSNQDSGRGESAYRQRQGENGPTIKRDGGYNKFAQHHASSSALASGVHNVGSNTSQLLAFWSNISNNAKKVGYFTNEENIKRISNLTNKGLNRPDQLSKILNEASRADVVERIIKGWEENVLNGILATVINIVGDDYKLNKDKKGSQEISLIFNALSKINDNGAKVEEFYNEVNKFEKWEQIIRDSNAQNISNIQD